MLASLKGMERGDPCSLPAFFAQASLRNVHNGLTRNGNLRQSHFYGGMSCWDFWCWLSSHGVFRCEIDSKSTTFLFDQCNQKIPK